MTANNYSELLLLLNAGDVSAARAVRAESLRRGDQKTFSKAIWVSRKRLNPFFLTVLQGPEKGRSHLFRAQTKIIMGIHPETGIFQANPEGIASALFVSTHETLAIETPEGDLRVLKVGERLFFGEDTVVGVFQSPAKVIEAWLWGCTVRKYFPVDELPLETPVLKFISGKYYGCEYPLSPNSYTVVGRSPDDPQLDMHLVESRVSRLHAVIEREEYGRILLRALQDSNGTFVNGKLVRLQYLEYGDQITMGTSILKLVDGAAKAVLEAPPRLEAVRLLEVLHSLVGNRKTGRLDCELEIKGVVRRSSIFLLHGHLAGLFVENEDVHPIVQERLTTLLFTSEKPSSTCRILLFKSMTSSALTNVLANPVDIPFDEVFEELI